MTVNIYPHNIHIIHDVGADVVFIPFVLKIQCWIEMKEKIQNLDRSQGILIGICSRTCRYKGWEELKEIQSSCWSIEKAYYNKQTFFSFEILHSNYSNYTILTIMLIEPI